MTIWRIRIACWITKATNTHSEHVILTVFPPQQWLHERTSVLRYTYIACLVFYLFVFCKTSHLGLSDIKRPVGASISPPTYTSLRNVCFYQTTIQKMVIQGLSKRFERFKCGIYFFVVIHPDVL